MEGSVRVSPGQGHRDRLAQAGIPERPNGPGRARDDPGPFKSPVLKSLARDPAGGRPGRRRGISAGLAAADSDSEAAAAGADHDLGVRTVKMSGL